MKAAVIAQGGDKFRDKHHFNVLIGQLVSLFRNGEPVRMSKRTGEMITFEEVIEDIGPDATRFFLIEKSPDTHVDFDLDLAKKKSNENPVFYIQYAHARICSILSKLKESNQTTTRVDSCALSETLHEKERILMRHAVTFYDDLFSATTQFAPHRFVQYIFQLARLFHHFYEACPIGRAEPSVMAYRTQLILIIQHLIATGLSILKISAPEKM